MASKLRQAIGDANRIRVVALFLRGHSAQEIARMVGLSLSRVREIIETSDSKGRKLVTDGGKRG